jgi:hypothetical protein
VWSGVGGLTKAACPGRSEKKDNIKSKPTPAHSSSLVTTPARLWGSWNLADGVDERPRNCSRSKTYSRNHVRHDRPHLAKALEPQWKKTVHGMKINGLG